jgi:hypothetical protein
MCAIIAAQPLRLGFRALVGYFAMRKFVPDPGVEIDPLGEGMTKRVGDLIRDT